MAKQSKAKSFMKKSYHHYEHERKKAIRRAQREPVSDVHHSMPDPEKLKKGIFLGADSPKKRKRMKKRQNELLSLEKDMERKKAKHNFKESKRTTPGKDVDYLTTQAHSHSQKGYKFADVNRKHTQEQNVRLRSKLQHRRSKGK